MLTVQRIKKFNLKQPVCLVATLLSITLLGSSFRSGKTDVHEMPDSIQMAIDSITSMISLLLPTYSVQNIIVLSNLTTLIGCAVTPHPTS